MTGSLRRFTLCLLAVGMILPAGASGLSLRARNAGVFDLDTGEWVYTKRADVPVPVASITKVLAALTIRRLDINPDTQVTILREDWYRAGRTRLRVGDTRSVRTLLQMALVASDNCAARSLARAAGMDRYEFGYQMQITAWQLGLAGSRFVEPSGLDHGNIATVRGVVLLFRQALEDPLLTELMGTEDFLLETRRGPRRIVHSSRMLRYRREVVAAKTGFLAEAGYCLVQRVNSKKGSFITVVLGAPTKGSRVRESVRLIDFTWDKLRRRS